MKIFNFVVTKIKNVDACREEKENEFADLMNKIGQNEAFKKAENEGADKLVALGIQAGITFAAALAAPVDEGIIFPAAARPPRQSLAEGPSTVFCVAVVA